MWNVTNIDDLHLVAVMPIAPVDGTPIGAGERAALDLPDPSNVVASEANLFYWPGPDIVPQKNRSLIRPKAASKALLDRIKETVRERAPLLVRRTP